MILTPFICIYICDFTCCEYVYLYWKWIYITCTKIQIWKKKTKTNIENPCTIALHTNCSNEPHHVSKYKKKTKIQNKLKTEIVRTKRKRKDRRNEDHFIRGLVSCQTSWISCKSNCPQTVWPNDKMKPWQNSAGLTPFFSFEFFFFYCIHIHS